MVERLVDGFYFAARDTASSEEADFLLARELRTPEILLEAVTRRFPKPPETLRRFARPCRPHCRAARAMRSLMRFAPKRTKRAGKDLAVFIGNRSNANSKRSAASCASKLVRVSLT